MTHITSGLATTGADSQTQEGRDSLLSVSAQAIAGVIIPDTALVREVTALIREAEDDLLFDHSRRVFLFGALQGQRRGLHPDLELLYVGAMFHDIGLTARYRRSNLRFEVDGANAARDFLLERGVDEVAARKVWLSIALHTTPGVPEFLGPEIALVTAGVETDVLGIGRDDLSAESLEAVTAAHPRPDFKKRIPSGVHRRQREPPEDHVRKRQRRCSGVHRVRVGANYNQLPVNAPQSPVHSYSTAGHMRYQLATDPVYAPNSKGGPQADTARYGQPAGWHTDGDTVRSAYTLRSDDDDWGQAGTLVRDVMNDAERDRLVGNVVGHLLNGVTEPFLQRAFDYWRNVDPDIGNRIEKGVRAG